MQYGPHRRGLHQNSYRYQQYDSSHGTLESRDGRDDNMSKEACGEAEQVHSRQESRVIHFNKKTDNKQNPPRNNHMYPPNPMRPSLPLCHRRSDPTRRMTFAAFPAQSQALPIKDLAIGLIVQLDQATLRLSSTASAIPSSSAAPLKGAAEEGAVAEEDAAPPELVLRIGLPGLPATTAPDPSPRRGACAPPPPACSFPDESDRFPPISSGATLEPLSGFRIWS